MDLLKKQKSKIIIVKNTKKNVLKRITVYSHN